MHFWEMFTQKAEEFFVFIWGNIKTKWWIKPYDLPFSIFGVICHFGCILLFLKCNLTFKSIFGQCISLDWLACFGYISGPQTGRIRKDFIKIFKENVDLSITCETNLKPVNFLDVTLNLTTGKYQPYNKPDNNPLYINILSNHPPNIIKNLHGNISKRIYQQTLSANSK